MSTIKANSFTHLDGTSAREISITGKNFQSIATGITWSTSYNATTQELGSLSNYTTSNTIAVRILHRYIHNGSTNHGYLAGYLFQKGTTYTQTGHYTNQTHYDWYYNVTTTPCIVPWDPSGDQTLNMYVVNAYNSSSSNTQAFYIDAIFEQS